MRPDYAQSVYRTLVLVPMSLPDSFPHHPLLRIWCAVVPLLSFAVISDAVVRLQLRRQAGFHLTRFFRQIIRETSLAVITPDGSPPPGLTHWPTM